jgi:hypothetical protein
MTKFYVISDVMDNPEAEAPEQRYVTGYWTGTELTGTLEEGYRYESISDAEIVLRAGDFYDPAVYEVETQDGKCVKGRFFDMVNKYGAAGGK